MSWTTPTEETSAYSISLFCPLSTSGEVTGQKINLYCVFLKDRILKGNKWRFQGRIFTGLRWLSTLLLLWTRLCSPLFVSPGREDELFVFYLKAGTLIGISTELYEVLESCWWRSDKLCSSDEVNTLLLPYKSIYVRENNPFIPALEKGNGKRMLFP